IRNALSELVDIRPNPYMSKRQFYANIVRVLFLNGNGNQVTVPIIKDGLINRLTPLKPGKVKFFEEGEGYFIKYGDKRKYSPDEIIHFRINPDQDKPWLGTGFARLLADAVVTMSQASATKKAILERPTPSLIVKVDSDAEELATPEGQQSLAERYAGNRKADRPWFIPATLMDIEQVKPLTMKDLAVAENLELDKRQIAAVFGVPAFMVGVGDFNKNEYNNFIRSRVMPIAKSIEQELTRQLLLKPEWYFKFNARSLMAYDLAEIVEAGGALVDRTALSRNELRDWISMSPRDDMEDLIILENYLPIDRIGDQKKLTGGDV
ncbi:MAG: phage portal protein, partial [Clostridiales bacterium]|nr:phage portal protein [Clostridiales bacterium]